MKRVKNEAHLAFIRSLPCVICGDNTSTEAAHIRYADPRVAKRPTGIGERPDDKFTVPLCGKHHRKQHGMSERDFWRGHRIDPILVALALWSVTGSVEAGEAFIRLWQSGGASAAGHSADAGRQTG